MAKKCDACLGTKQRGNGGAYIAERVIAAVDLLARLLRHCVEQLIVVVGVDELKILKSAKLNNEKTNRNKHTFVKMKSLENIFRPKI
jgi:hypothetical protein